MAHVLVVPMPGQGHINPMVQFAKRLVSKGVAATLVTTRFIARTARIDAGGVQVEAISDGHDDGGFSSAASPEEYMRRFEATGSASLAELIRAHTLSGRRPFTCVVHDSFLRWAARTARAMDLLAVPFSTQSSAVSAVYHYVNERKLSVPAAGGEKSVALAGLPEMERWEFPTFVFGNEPYQLLTVPALTQFADRDEDDWVLFNSFQELEGEVLAGLSSHFKARAIGPCVPLPAAESGDADRFTYGADMLDPAEDTCIKWLDTKPLGSVVYVSFGSFASVGAAQSEELARGLLAAGKPFLWVVRATEEAQLPRHLLDAATSSGVALVVRWCPQLDVLAHRAVGCFVTHCGWNSTLEALGFGVPMVALPIWTDQPINARLIEGAGVRARRDAASGMFLRDEIERCVSVVMGDGGIAAAKREAARRWRDAARAAVTPGGSSDRNLDEFVEFVRANVDKKNRKRLGLEKNESAAARSVQDVICM